MRGDGGSRAQESERKASQWCHSLAGTEVAQDSFLPALGGKQQPRSCSCTSELSSRLFCKFHTRGPSPASVCLDQYLEQCSISSGVSSAHADKWKSVQDAEGLLLGGDLRS